MERRRKGEPDGEKLANMERAAKRGWKSVFAGGRWEEDSEGAGDVEVYEQAETIPFISALMSLAGGGGPAYDSRSPHDPGLSHTIVSF